MAVVYGTVTQLGPLSQQYPPPLLPKPGKDNVRLQKLLKRTAKKKTSSQTSQSAAPFRSSLSPVNEASPDLERSDHSTPPRTPETSSNLYSIHQPPRFSVRPLYQHVASPYPQRAAFGRTSTASPQTLAIPSYSYSHHVTAISSYSTGTQASRIMSTENTRQLPSSRFEVTEPKTESKASIENHAALRWAPQSPVPIAHPTSAGQALTKPLTVLTQLVKSKSPRPTFKATEPSKSPRTMFDVPQIRMYTASTSYYETSRTPPVHDTAALTSIGSIVTQSTALPEPKQDLPPVSEFGRAKTTTPPLSTGTRSERKTSNIEMQKATPTSEIKRTVPLSEIQETSPTSEAMTVTPASEFRMKTPTHELQTSRIAGRPRTPAYHITRATTPVFEVSRPNPLLFAVSPITVDPDRSRSPRTISSVRSSPASLSMKTTGPLELPNEDVPSEMTPVGKPTRQGIIKSKSEPNLREGTISKAQSDTQRAKTPTSVPMIPIVTSHQRPKTPTYEALRLITMSPVYKRPKTPTYGISGTNTSHVPAQKSTTLVPQTSKSTYRGLTPVEYTAYGGIKTYSQPFGVSISITPTKDEVQGEKANVGVPREVIQELNVKGQVRDPIKPAEEPHKNNQKVSHPATIPLIVVSKASDSFGTTVMQETKVTDPTAEKQDVTVVQETPQTPPTASESSEKEKTGSTQALPKRGGQDPLKSVRKISVKDGGQTEMKLEVSVQNEPMSAPKLKPESSQAVFKPSHVPTVEMPELKEKQTEKRPLEKTEAEDSLPAAESLLKVVKKPKGMKNKMSGWSRLKKHMVVEQEEPKFPEAVSEEEVSRKDKLETTPTEEKLDIPSSAQDELQSKDTPKATKMWDAVLFQMFSTKENIMHQIELNKSEEDKNEDEKEDLKEIPSFAYRLPVLLFSPKFDAKKLKEAASRPVTKISTVFEMGLIGRKGKEEEPKDFNRTARGFTVS